MNYKGITQREGDIFRTPYWHIKESTKYACAAAFAIGCFVGWLATFAVALFR